MRFLNHKPRKTDEKKAPSRHVSSASMQNPKILEVNLIKDEAQISFDWPKNLLMLSLVLAFGALLIGEACWILGRWEDSERANLEPLTAKVDILNQDIAKLKNDNSDALLYQEKSRVFTELLNNHVYWTKTLDWLEKNTLSSVHYSGFSGDLTGSYELQAMADSYSDASWQARVLLSDPVVQEVNIKQVSGGGTEEATGVQFVLGFKLKPEIFKK